MHEASMHEENCFITLTYSDEYLPDRNKLHKQDIQKFLKRVRKKYKVRYYYAGEYGPENGRPHYHMIMFGHDWPDKQYLKTTGANEKIYISRELDKLWGMGYCSTAAVTFESAAYVARYCMEKITGDLAEEHYKRYDYLGEYQLTPEFNDMSRKPGIGATWLNKYQSDVYNYDYVVVNGVQTRPPKFYDKLFQATNEDEFDQLKEERILAAKERYLDNTEERLLVKEKVAKAKTQSLKRGKL